MKIEYICQHGSNRYIFVTNINYALRKSANFTFLKTHLAVSTKVKNF